MSKADVLPILKQILHELRELNKRRDGRAAYTRQEFCDAYRISRTEFYRLEKMGQGPREMLLKGRTGKAVKRITHEAAAEWQRRIERGEQFNDG